MDKDKKIKELEDKIKDLEVNEMLDEIDDIKVRKEENKKLKENIRETKRI